MPFQWKAIFFIAALAGVVLYLMEPGSRDVAVHEKQAITALTVSLLVSVLLSALAGMLHRGRQFRAGALMLVATLLMNAALFAAYSSAFHLFGF